MSFPKIREQQKNFYHEENVEDKMFVFLSGTLQNRSLGEIVRKEDLVDSEYLTTLLVLVARCGTRPVLVLHVCLMAFVLFFSFETFNHTRFPSQGELPAVGEHLRVLVRAGGSALQQVSSVSRAVRQNPLHSIQSAHACYEVSAA